MKVKELAVPGAFEFIPATFPDRRGLNAVQYAEPAFAEAVGHPLRIAQANHTVSHRGVIRGVHFADVPPGQAKFVYCPRGAVLDIVIDIRVGSPNFGQWDSVRCDDTELRAVYLPAGVGHAFMALTDDSVINYLLSTSYNPKVEHTVNPLDPAMGLPWPADVEYVLSDRDAAAPTLAEAAEAGLLPSYADCLALHH